MKTKFFRFILLFQLSAVFAPSHLSASGINASLEGICLQCAAKPIFYFTNAVLLSAGVITLAAGRWLRQSEWWNEVDISYPFPDDGRPPSLILGVIPCEEIIEKKSIPLWRSVRVPSEKTFDARKVFREGSVAIRFDTKSRFGEILAIRRGEVLRSSFDYSSEMTTGNNWLRSGVFLVLRNVSDEIKLLVQAGDLIAIKRLISFPYNDWMSVMDPHLYIWTSKGMLEGILRGGLIVNKRSVEFDVLCAYEHDTLQEFLNKMYTIRCTSF